MKKINILLAVMCLTLMTAIGFVSCSNASAPAATGPSAVTIVAQYQGTAEGSTDTITIRSDGTWAETWAGNGSTPTSGTYTISSGNETNGTINIVVTASTVTAVPVGTSATITITNGTFTFNGTNYTKI